MARGAAPGVVRCGVSRHGAVRVPVVLAGVACGLDPRAYYELLFCGRGHVLQFTWTLLMLVAWLWLADAIGARLPLSPRVVLVLFALALLLVFLTPLVVPFVRRDLGRASPLAYVDDAGRRRIVDPADRPRAGLALVELRGVGARRRPLRAALLMSVLLFAAAARSASPSAAPT